MFKVQVACNVILLFQVKHFFEREFSTSFLTYVIKIRSIKVATNMKFSLKSLMETEAKTTKDRKKVVKK